MSKTIITFDGTKLVVQPDGRFGVSRLAFTPEQCYALSPDMDWHASVVLAIANPGVPMPILGSARANRPRHATVHSVCM